MAPIQIDPVGAFVDSLGDDVPSELQCGITGELFVDPVVNARGHTYERSAIEPWLITHQTDPLTREALPNRDLAPNWTVRHSLESFRARVLLIAPDAAAWMPPPPPPVTGGAAAALRPLPPDRGLRHRDPPGPP
ncbi:U box domain containing protein, partial [Klebsormidium nitens]